jgi:hypothetical protein
VYRHAGHLYRELLGGRRGGSGKALGGDAVRTKHDSTGTVEEIPDIHADPEAQAALALAFTYDTNELRRPGVTVLGDLVKARACYIKARELMDAAGRRGDHHERIIANIPICRSSCSRERTARRL